ncbi:cointegrate resolution protein T [Stenotrophomonas maltophilia]|uniref:DNA-binding protein n=1 Tax=Stenotrophomonas maltophilia TaxID=40324 RepID=UPI0013DB1B0C|nr:DNA-binding protein [Stenotrophomonas maltophilia]MBA0275138.1 cointegrate resolution protein T [Stenotrophomonas maltophilia]MBA0411159.1 cointegrate resolution protein T [Stenotrophomonas maltophilia]MBA0496515.1 cointegrate resolution protein T [Stenotrophomonas maltophilia]MBA0501214.1 cointegrate resolution protein T [Stenotrophomonas maltophilia]MBA0505199.1 cointegrate resolution protein T [Stenotrophomonas maltophilia]
MGTGSPNTVTRWLETWWNRLGTRLQAARPDLDDAPAVLAELAGQWWELALKHAREAAHRELAEAEQSLAAQRDAQQAESRLVADEVTQVRSERDAAITGQRIATTQAAELQQLVEQLRRQISELTEQRDLELRRADRIEAARQQLDVRLHEALETAKSEREDWTEYVRSVENRTLSDVDRARQDVKELQAQLSKTSEQHTTLENQLRQDIQAAQSAAATATQSADILRGRCDALEGQISILRDMPTQLEAALKRSEEARIATDVRPKRKRSKQ